MSIFFINVKTIHKKLSGTGIRTPVLWLRTIHPSPLDDTALKSLLTKYSPYVKPYITSEIRSFTFNKLYNIILGI